MRRKYAAPSKTSRKRLPKAVERTLPASKRRRVSSTESVDSDNEVLDLELVGIVEANRKKNTLAARVSRQRKKEHLDALDGENARLKAELDELKKANRQLKAENAVLRCAVQQ